MMDLKQTLSKEELIEAKGLKALNTKDDMDVLERIKNSDARTFLLQTTDITNNTVARNKFAQLLRDRQSELTPRFTRDDRVWIDIWRRDYYMYPEDRPKLLFLLNDVIYQIQYNKQEREYEAFENWGGGILSDFIKGELELGRGFTLLIKGRPRSGKSLGGVTIGFNVSGNKFEIGTPEEPKDIVYTDNDYYKVRERRRLEKSLNGSTQIIDEGIEVVDSLKGVWDESIQGMIKTVKTQQFENSLLIVITPDESDIAKKLRESFSAVMEPWYDDDELPEGEIKNREINWSSRTGYSTWKFHLNKKGREHGERLDVSGLGKISKINIQLPPKVEVKAYLKVSEPHKRHIQERESDKAEKRQYKAEPHKFIEDKVDEIIAKGVDAVRNEKGKLTIDSIHTIYPKLSYTAARKICSRLKKRLEVKGETVKQS